MENPIIIDWVLVIGHYEIKLRILRLQKVNFVVTLTKKTVKDPTDNCRIQDQWQISRDQGIKKLLQTAFMQINTWESLQNSKCPYKWRWLEENLLKETNDAMQIWKSNWNSSQMIWSCIYKYIHNVALNWKYIISFISH